MRISRYNDWVGNKYRGFTVGKQQVAKVVAAAARAVDVVVVVAVEIVAAEQAVEIVAAE